MRSAQYNPYVQILTALAIGLSIILFSAAVGLSQQVYFPDGQKHYTDRCEIAVVNSKTDKVRVLGEFKFLRSESESGEASFRLPGTKLYVVGWAGLDDESMRSPTESYSVSMELMISRTRKRDVLKSVQYAYAEMLATSEMGRLAFSTRTNGKSTTVSMICESLNFRKSK